MSTYPAPYPSPYQYPPFQVPPPPPSTPKGIVWCVRALMLYPASLVLLAISGIVALSLLGNFQPGQDPFQGFAFFLPLLALAAAGGILALVAFIFYLVGFGYTYKGRNELGPAHARNVRIALYLLILAIVLAVASAVTSSILFFLAIRVDFFGGTTTLNAGMFYAAQVASIAFGIAIAACLAAHLVLTVRALAKPAHERLLYAAAAIGTATPGVAGAVLLLVIPRYLALFTNGGTPFPPVGAEVGLPNIVSASMTIVTVLLFLIAFRGAEARLRSGELKATVPPPQTPASWMPAPVTPSAPYWPYPQQAPAPAMPPEQPPPSPPTL